MSVRICFYNLVKAGFFNNTAFFRVVPGFYGAIRPGCQPGSWNKAWQTANITDDPVMSSNKRGFVTFAMSGNPNSRATQVFINLVDNTRLDAEHFAPFGQVVWGWKWWTKCKRLRRYAPDGMEKDHRISGGRRRCVYGEELPDDRQG